MEYNVIYFNFNSKKMEQYNIMPHLLSEFNKLENKPKAFDEFKDFILKKSFHQWWSRCEYEIILSDWPSQTIKEKWDIYKQIEMNIDIITCIFIINIEHG